MGDGLVVDHRPSCSGRKRRQSSPSPILSESLEADLADEDPVSQKIEENLANIASERWGISLCNEKPKLLLNTHKKSVNVTLFGRTRLNENCVESFFIATHFETLECIEEHFNAF